MKQANERIATRRPLLVLGSLLLRLAQAQPNPSPATVDLMVVYTPQALTDAGGEARLHAQIDGFVAEANRCFSNSQVNARFSLVHCGRVTYTESGDWSTDRTRLRTAGDGYLDEVHALRNLHKADLVMLHEWGPNANSVIYTGGSDAGFNVVGRHAALTVRMLPTHELAHNFGPRDRVVPASSGERLANRFVAGGILYHTIVAYDPGISVPYFSGTNVQYSGVPTGSTSADNDVGLMNQNAPSIERFCVATNRLVFATVRHFIAENAGTASVEVLRLGDVNTTASVDVQVTAGSARAGTEFIAQTNRLTFAPGVETLSCPVTILDNAECQGKRTVQLSLRPPPGDASYTAARGNALGRPDVAELVIQDDDSGFVLGATHYAVPETSGAVTVQVTRVGDLSAPGSIGFATGDGTALAGLNYVATSGQLSFAAGEAEQPLSLTVLNDSVPGDDRTFSLALLDPSPGTGLGQPASATLTILDRQRPGSLDATFDLGDGPNRPVLILAVRPDGRLLCGGQFTRFNGLPHAGLAQLLPDGSLDAAWQPVRVAVGPDPGDGEVYGGVWAIAEQPDGRLLVGGEFPTVNGVARPNLARFHGDGQLDVDFEPAVPNGRIQQIVLQPDGKILIGGAFTTVGGQWRPMTARLNPHGSLDASFRYAISGFVNLAALALQPDGKILVGYYNNSFAGTCARLHPDGTRDLGFQQPNVGTWTIPSALAVLPDGRILMGGDFATVNGRARRSLARLNPDGSLDESFAAPFERNGYVTSLVPLPGGRVLVAGMLGLTNMPGRHNLVRLNADGSLDRSFQVGTGPNDFVFSMAAHTSGAVYLGGAFEEINGQRAPRLARVRCDATAPRFETPAWVEEQLRLRLRSLPGIFALQHSPDLRAWTTVHMMTNLAGVAEFADPDVPLPTRRCYRVAQP